MKTRKNGDFVRKTVLTVASIATIFGVCIGMAAPASAQPIGAYKTQAECEAQIQGQSRYSCQRGTGGSDSGPGYPWLLHDEETRSIN
jgi:hypothetical protein